MPNHKKISVFVDESTAGSTSLNEDLNAAVNILRNPCKNALRHKLARIISKLPLISARSRVRFLRSAQKRDHKRLYEKLRTAQSLISSEPDQPFESLHLKYINSLLDQRPKVVQSNWHANVIKSLSEPPIDKLPTITVSLVTYNSSRWLPDFFHSLRSQNYPLSRLNVKFVDNGSKDETVDEINQFIQENSELFASIKLYERDNNGFGAGHDHAIRQSSDPFVLVSNVDLIFHCDTISRVVAVALVDQDDIASWEVRQCPFEHPKHYDPVTLETHWSSHACVLMRRSAYLKVGGYEDRIFMYGEDVELSYRYRGAGFRLRYLPQVTVTHHVSFDKPELRPHQLSGSVSANVLLRHRYGGAKMGKYGEELLRRAIDVEADSDRKQALESALEKIGKDKKYFSSVRIPNLDAHFPFDGFEYGFNRLGHEVDLKSDGALTDKPLVSIVTRTHGPNISLLMEAIASVLNQSYPNIEHLIVEDRTDYAKEFVESVKASYSTNIRYVKSGETAGAGRSVAGNAGLKAAKGEFLLMLDNDDLLFGDHVELLVERMTRSRKAVAAYSAAWEVPSFYASNGRYREGRPSIPDAHLLPYKSNRFRKGNFIPIQSILFRRTLFEEHGGFDTSIDLLEDWNLWARYSRSGNFEFVPKVTSLYRIPGDPRIRGMRKKLMEEAEQSVFQKTFGNTSG